MNINTKIKNANTFSDNPNTEKLNRFLSRLYPIDGQVAAAFSEYEGDSGVGRNFSASKIRPKKETTPTLADQLLNIDASSTYIQLATHYFSHEGWYNEKTVKMINAIMVDVDDFPLAKYTDKLAAVMEEYPFLKELMPTYIVDTGKKGFQVYWMFGWDTKINDSRKEFFAARALLTAILHGDHACEASVQSARLPYSKRTDGNTPEIIFESEENYNFMPFLGRLLYLCREYVVDFDGRTWHRDSESLFSDDIQTNLIDYYSDRLDFPIGKKLSFWFSEDTITEMYEEQLCRIQTWYKEHSAEYEEKEDTPAANSGGKRTYTKNLSHFAKRKFDLNKLLEVTNGELTGYRNCFLYIYGSNEAYMCKNIEHVKETLYAVNRRFTEPLMSSEVDTIFRSISKKRRNYSDIRVGEILPMYRLDNTFLIYNPVTKKELEEKKKAQLNKKLEDKKRKKDQMFRNKFIVAAAQETSVTKLAKKMHISRPTAYKYKKLFSEIIERLKKSARQISTGVISNDILKAQENHVCAAVNST